MPKVHKTGIPLRPVVSMIGTAQYGLGKYLDGIIKPCIPNDHMLLSSSDFIERLSSVTFPSQYSMVSFDVVSLYTNVPLAEAIELACS